ncbi:carbohydrate-binding protein [Exilibacterium tricleocarpae]|uniref:Carbohydrate-binding protein n=2 Tax=Exilibacterium tricleocarpae TaxID=2591008 RepID=A0A545T055_9GAMM|nr:carbohydrate-binding protein [Exilibacterium tricleocarpae]
MFFTDAPSVGPDGDSVVQAFFGITRYIEGSEPYSEIDFEYLPNGGWYTGSYEPSMWSGTYRIVDFSDPSNHAVTRTTGSLQGWHDLVMQVRDGQIDFFIDGQHQTGFSGSVTPDYPMFLMFQIWFSNDCFDLSCTKRGYLTDSNYREYYQDVDWVYFEKDTILSPAQVLQNVQDLRAQDIDFVKGNKPAGGGSTTQRCNWWGTIYNICTHIETGWGWQNNADCVGINTCATLPPPYGIIEQGSAFSRLIQAESYSNMAGVDVENTTDTGQGQNVGWIDTGDWMSYYDIAIPSTGSYRVEYRVASINGARLSLDLNGGDLVLGAVDIPATGGWQSWETVSHTVTLAAGSYNVGIYALSGGWNINWFRITKVE